jgi:hypothetical protein
MAVSPVSSTFLWAEGGDGGMDDLGRHFDRPEAFPQKLSVMNFRVTQDFLAGSKCSYRTNIGTIFLAGRCG